MSCRDELDHGVRADVAGAAADEYAHARNPIDAPGAYRIQPRLGVGGQDSRTAYAVPPGLDGVGRVGRDPLSRPIDPR
ncbi:hypothetical protein GCM10027053_07870 [Intrasporangium mesophilum]